MAELSMYEVQHRGIKTMMKMSDEDAAVYGDLAKKVGDVKPAERQDVTQPPWATLDSEKESEATPPQAESKKAPIRRNKRSAAASDK